MKCLSCHTVHLIPPRKIDLRRNWIIPGFYASTYIFSFAICFISVIFLHKSLMNRELLMRKTLNYERQFVFASEALPSILRLCVLRRKWIDSEKIIRSKSLVSQRELGIPSNEKVQWRKSPLRSLLRNYLKIRLKSSLSSSKLFYDGCDRNPSQRWRRKRSGMMKSHLYPIEASASRDSWEKTTRDEFVRGSEEIFSRFLIVFPGGSRTAIKSFMLCVAMNESTFLIIFSFLTIIYIFSPFNNFSVEAGRSSFIPFIRRLPALSPLGIISWWIRGHSMPFRLKRSDRTSMMRRRGNAG